MADNHSFIRLGLTRIFKDGISYFLIFALVFICSDAVAQITVDTPRTIRVVMDNNYAPYVFQSGEGKLQGILIDQWQEWEKNTGIMAEIHAMDWSEALRSMRAGEFDVIDCIVETADRQDYFDFTPAYNTIEASVYFRNNISGISDAASLKGFPIGVKTGDQHIDKLKASGVTSMILFHNNDAIIEAAKKHTINVFLVDDPSAVYLLNKMDMESEFRHTAPIFRDELRRAVRKGDTATLNIISKGFAAIEPGKLKQIDEKWFGLTINRDKRYLHYLTYAAYAVAAAILLIAGLLVWNRTLRKRVLRRTAALSIAYQRLSYHVENTPLAVIEWDKDLFVKRWSEHAEEIFGWKTSEALGKNMNDPDFPIVYKEDIEAVNKIVEQLLKGIVDRNLSLNRNYTKDGKIIYCEWYNSVLRDVQGNVITILSLIHNVTERKKAEETLQQSYEEIRRMTEHLQNIREEERTYIAREIHDELGQQLTAIKMDVAWNDKKTPEETIEIKRKLKNIIALLDGSNQSIRRILSELRPRILDEHGWLEAIEWLGRQFTETTGIPVKFTAPEKDVKVSEQIATCIFRVCQEAFTNITRYALAKNVSISINIIEENIILIIEDDGIGFDAAAIQTKKSFGILGMKERILSLDGKFELVSSPGKGTKITVSLPYRYR
jgi:PAS domain S-box-containing protein